MGESVTRTRSAPGVSVGHTLSHYEITAKLGEGGMGEVYRARDTKLGREVAIKVLPEVFTSAPDRFARFEREAHLLASLNHPNIAAIYDLAEDDGTHFLVLELAEGEDLAKQLSRGSVPIVQALPLALQIAEALEAAHHKGIIHRDLKPANVMVGPGGKVKVLDFGLAKAWAVEGEDSENLSISPTLTAEMTQAGTLLGTPAYMSPEQTRGESADSRADVWAFGVVLMEMLTGKNVYAGKTASDSLAAVLTREPAWDDLPNETPPSIRRLLERSLEKERSERLQAIGEARIGIDRYLTAPEAENELFVAGAAPRQPAWRRLLPWAVAGALAIALVAALLKPRAGPTSATRAAILPPEGTSFDLDWSEPGLVVVSPDGRSLAFSAIDADGKESLYVRDLENGEARPLAATGEVAYPFWSPDGRFLAFFADQELKKIGPSGGPAMTLAAAVNGKGGTWNRNGDIVFAPTGESGLYRVSAAGGEVVELTEVDRERFDSHRFPQFLPDGEHFLYLARADRSAFPPPARHGDNHLMVGSLAGDDPVELFPTSAAVLYASGHLFFLVENTLMARPFDPQSLEVTGEMFPVAEEVVVSAGAARGAFSISEGGTLAFHAGEFATGGILQWVDREGRIGATLGPRSDYREVRLSPDGQRAAVSIRDQESGTQDLWILDLERRLRDRFTFDESQNWHLAWSSDGERIAFSSWRGQGGPFQIYVKPVLTGEKARPLVESEEDKFLWDWSPDERYVTYGVFGSETSVDQYAVDLIEGGDPIPLQPSRFFEGQMMVSPDGRWLAYFTNASGPDGIYVTAFPAGGRRWQVSSDGGAWPLWDPSGRWLYWLASGQSRAGQAGRGQALMSAEVDGSGEVFRIGEVSKIADGFEIPSVGPYPYDITPDGQRFLFIVEQKLSVPALTLLLDLPAELRGDGR